MVRVGVWLVLSPNRFASDEASYFSAGTMLASRGEQDFFWPPVTGWLIASAELILRTTDIRWIRLVWIALDVGALLILRALARRLARAAVPEHAASVERFATLVTVAYALYLPAVSFAQFVTSETPALLLTLLVLLLVTGANQRSLDSLLAGVLTGFLALTRTNLLTLLVFVPSAIFATRPPHTRLRNSCVFLVGAVVVVGAALLRNWGSIGELTLARNSAYNLYIGNQDFYAEDLNLFQPVATREQVEFRRQFWSGELVYPNHTPAALQQEALAWIRSHPGTFARRALGRLARVFAPKTDVLELIGGEQRAGIFSPRAIATLAVANAQWLFVLVGGVVGLTAVWQIQPLLGVPLVSIVIGSLPLCTIAIAKPRYAFVFEPLLLLGAAVLVTFRSDVVPALQTGSRWVIGAVVTFLIWSWLAWLVFAFSSRMTLS